MIADYKSPDDIEDGSELAEVISKFLPYLTTSGNQQVTIRYLQAVLAQPLSHLLVAFDGFGDRAVGMCNVICVLTPDGLHSYLHSVVVHPDFRRQGWGERLVSCAIQVVEECVVFASMPTILEFTSKPKREAANAMYQKMGFKLVAAAVPDDEDGTNLYRMRIPLPLPSTS